VRTTRTTASNKEWKSKGDFIDNLPWGKEQRHSGAYPTGANYIAKEGRRLAPLTRRLPRQGRLFTALRARGRCGGEDPHRGLQHPQLEAEDEVVADAEAVAEGESPPASGEDGVAARSEDDVHRPEEI
jgi:hypothetical protein